MQFRYYPAQSIYQRPGQAIFSKSRPNGRFINARPNGRFINARPNGRFIKAEAAKWPDVRFELRAANSVSSRTISLSATGPSYFQQKPESTGYGLPWLDKTVIGFDKSAIGTIRLAVNDKTAIEPLFVSLHVSLDKTATGIKPRQPVDHFIARRPFYQKRPLGGLRRSGNVKV